MPRTDVAARTSSYPVLRAVSDWSNHALPKLSHSAVVPVPPEAAIDFLADLSKQRGLNPSLVEARVSECDRRAGSWTQWQVYERARLGPFHYSIRYGVRLTREIPTSFTSVVHAAPGYAIRSVTTARAGDTSGWSVVDEHSIITAPRILLLLVVRRVRRARARTYRLLPAVLG